jgi:hypothetical protein
MGYSARSLNESQHRLRHISRGNSRVALSRQYICGVEVQWVSLVDLRQTYALLTPPRITLISVFNFSRLWKEHSVVRHCSHLHTSRQAYVVL